MRDIVTNVRIYGLEESIQGAKFSMAVDIDKITPEITKGMQNLAMSEIGGGHDQFLTGITVQFDLNCSNKMWVEAERYRFLYFVSSQSTMHRITKFNVREQYNEYVNPAVIDLMEKLVREYNELQKIDTDSEILKQKYLEILYTNPAGFCLAARMTTNYRQLKTIYKQRKDHRLPEWRAFCQWCETLPHAEWITGKTNEKDCE